MMDKNNIVSFNTILQKSIERVNKNISCACFVHETKCNDKRLLTMFFDVFPIERRSELGSIIVLCFNVEIKDDKDKFNRIEEFKSDIIHYLLTNKEVRGVLYNGTDL